MVSLCQVSDSLVRVVPRLAASEKSMKILPSGKVKWVLIVFLLYAYYSEYGASHFKNLTTSKVASQANKAPEKSTLPGEEIESKEAITKEVPAANAAEKNIDNPPKTIAETTENVVVPQEVTKVQNQAQNQAQTKEPESIQPEITKQKSEVNNEKQEEGRAFTLSSEIANKLKQNETTKMFMDAVVRKKIQEKYGTGQMRVIAARLTGELAIVDVIKGAGKQLNCGATASFNYNAYTANGLLFDSTENDNNKKPVTITVGTNQMIRGLESGIVGMQEGGTRKISIPASLGFNVPGLDENFTNNVVGKDEVLTFEVELLKVKDSPYDGVHVNIDSYSNNYAKDGGQKILCGDRLVVKYSFKNLDNSPISSEAELELRLGSGNVPVGMEVVLIDMRLGDSRSVTLYPNMQKIPGKSILPEAIKFPKNQPVRLNVEVVGIKGI